MVFAGWGPGGVRDTASVSRSVFRRRPSKKQLGGSHYANARESSKPVEKVGVAVDRRLGQFQHSAECGKGEEEKHNRSPPTPVCSVEIPRPKQNGGQDEVGDDVIETIDEPGPWVDVRPKGERDDAHQHDPGRQPSPRAGHEMYSLAH